MKRAALLVVAVVAALTAGRAQAHQRSLSFSSWDIRGREAWVTLRVSELDLSRIALPPAAAGTDPAKAYGPKLTAWLELLAGEEACAVSSDPGFRRLGDGQVALDWRVRCPDSGSFTIRSRLFADTSSTHLHFARVRRDGGEPEERVLSERTREWPLSVGRGEPIAGYLRLGIEHILSGYDHLAFVAALLLVAGSLGGVARVVTGFTIAHSITLALSVTGVVRLEDAPTEALIGLSIALVAVENLWLGGSRSASVPRAITFLLGLLGILAAAGAGNVPALTLWGLAIFTASYFSLLARSRRPEALRGAIAFLFGLLHGFGFASVLLDAGLAPGELASALFGFNVGVEVGQLAVVAVLWLALRQTGQRRKVVSELGSASVLALGVFWFVVRTFG